MESAYRKSRISIRRDTVLCGNRNFVQPACAGLGRICAALAAIKPRQTEPSRRACGTRRTLETQLRSERDFPVAAGSVGKNQLVSDFQAQPDRTKKGLHSAARIKHAIDIVRPQVINAAGKSGERCRRGIEAKIREPALEGYEQTHRPSGLELRTEQAVKDADIGILRGDRAAGSIGEALRENAVKIVGHLRFDLHVGSDIDAGAAAEPDKISARFAQSEIVDK